MGQTEVTRKKTKMESAHDPNSKDEILKTIEEMYEKEKNDPDPEVRNQAMREIEMLKEQASGIIDSLSCLSIKPPKPKIPNGYRLPTKSEYLSLEKMGQERQEIRHLINSRTGKEKKELLQQYRELIHKMAACIDTQKIYYVPGSNRYIGSKEYL